MDAHLGERLSALVDGEVGGAEREAAEAHLTACAECRAAYDALLRIKRHAEALDDRPPERDLWPGIAARLGHEAAVIPLAPRRRRVAFSIPQLAAAALVLMTVSAGAVLLATHGRHAAPASPFASPTIGPIAGLASAKGVESYDAAIRDLENTLASRRSSLDTGTVRAIQQSLSIIDGAIRQAEAALAQDPNSMYLNSHLEHALGRKLEVLRRVTTLTAAS